MHFPTLESCPSLAEHMKAFEAMYPGVPLIQDTPLAALSPDEREFLISGSTPDDWDRLFGEEE
jgi:hypothetical protein